MVSVMVLLCFCSPELGALEPLFPQPEPRFDHLESIPPPSGIATGGFVPWRWLEGEGKMLTRKEKGGKEVVVAVEEEQSN